MPVDIDKTAATKLLHDSYLSCSSVPVTTCVIGDTIDFVMGGRNCLTYRYIMFTALVAKAVDSSVDILSLQAGDESAGAYDARSLASKVVFPFQKQMLGNVLDGSNSDPLVNKPGRFMRLRKSNPAAGGDPKRLWVHFARACRGSRQRTKLEDALTISSRSSWHERRVGRSSSWISSIRLATRAHLVSVGSCLIS